MGGFKEFMYGWLVENGYLDEESDTTVEDLTEEFITSETDCTYDMIEDAWFEYSADCDSSGTEPVNDMDGFTEPY